MNLEEFKKLPIIGIIRGIELEKVEPLVDATISSGLKTIEITMNSEGASDFIKQTVKAADGKLTVGAGTVLNMDDLKSAIDAGAEFIVSPVLVDDVVKYCVENNIPVFPGALTPQEIFNAWEAGATMVKVFPVKFFGPSYFKIIKAPLNKVKLLACGGVNPDNIQSFFSSGASAAAFGASIFNKEWIESSQYSQITKSIQKLIKALKI